VFSVAAARAIETAGLRRLSLLTSLCSVRITRRLTGSRSHLPFCFDPAAGRSGSDDAAARPARSTLLLFDQTNMLSSRDLYREADEAASDRGLSLSPPQCLDNPVAIPARKSSRTTCG